MLSRCEPGSPPPPRPVATSGLGAGESGSDTLISNRCQAPGPASPSSRSRFPMQSVKTEFGWADCVETPPFPQHPPLGTRLRQPTPLMVSPGTRLFGTLPQPRPTERRGHAPGARPAGPASATRPCGPRGVRVRSSVRFCVSRCLRFSVPVSDSLYYFSFLKTLLI